ncbi:unnamed protein product [Closterium sp. NIES-54]
MAISESVGRKIALSYFYVLVWIVLSFSVIVFNKYILDRKLYNWPYPISLTMIHMAFCSALAFLLVKVFRVVEPVALSTEMYLTSVLPIGALYSLSLWFSNSAYIYLSVSFIQVGSGCMLATPHHTTPHHTTPYLTTPHPLLTSVLPIGVLYSLSLWFSNSAYIYLSVSFIQVGSMCVLATPHHTTPHHTTPYLTSPHDTLLAQSLVFQLRLHLPLRLLHPGG